MRRSLGTILVLTLSIASLAAGCARRAAVARSASTTAQASTRPASDPRARLALDQIEPVPTLASPTTTTTTAPAGHAPLDAIELFAAARDARARNQPFSAINLLERAYKLDPHSFEINLALGSAYQRVGNAERAAEAYARGAAIRADDLILQAELGRAYMQRGDADRGILHLRLARLTTQYGEDVAVAAAVDYRLGLALQQAGYDRAALEVYDALLKRLQNPTPAMRANAEVAHVISRPEFLLEQVARLYEKQGQHEEALRAWEFVARRAPDDFAAQSRVVNAQLATSRKDDALAGAARLVTKFRASPESLALMRDVYRRAGRQDALIVELRRLRASRPDDRVVLFALADALESTGHPREAERLLADAARDRRGDVEIVARLAELFIQRARLDQAARVLVEHSAHSPGSTSELQPVFERLVSPGRRDALRIADVERLVVEPGAEPARLFYLSRVAQAWNRSSLAGAALQQASAARPVFPPAFHATLDEIWSEDAWDEEQKEQATAPLITAAREAGDESLALDLEGRALMARRKLEEASRSLDAAVAAAGGNPSPDLLFAQAAAARGRGDAQRFEQLCWRLVSDHPRFAPAYSALFRHSMDRGNFNAARNVLTTWLSNMPGDVEARLTEASVQLGVMKQPAPAERSLLALFAEHPDRLDVLANLRLLYSQSNQLAKFIDLLEQERLARPYNYPAVAQLVDVYASQKRMAEATRVLDAARAALADDADRLYFIAHLYQRVEQPRQNEETLEQVLRVDPSFAPAGNDLGYTWADAGRNLDRAESMIRRAVDSEPANPMFLDSLGWVLYKQGRFDEARRHLEQAAADERGVDPVILDHLGDVLYRLNESDGAVARWRDSLRRIAAAPDAERQQHNTLRLQLDQKLKQAEQRQPVSVAPVGESRAMSR